MKAYKCECYKIFGTVEQFKAHIRETEGVDIDIDDYIRVAEYIVEDIEI